MQQTSWQQDLKKLKSKSQSVQFISCFILIILHTASLFCSLFFKLPLSCLFLFFTCLVVLSSHSVAPVSPHPPDHPLCFSHPPTHSQHWTFSTLSLTPEDFIFPFNDRWAQVDIIFLTARNTTLISWIWYCSACVYSVASGCTRYISG